MADDLKQRIIENLNQKSTDELLDIWENGTEEEWQPFVFDAVKEILSDRQITIIEEEVPDEIPEELPNRQNKLQADEELIRAEQLLERNIPGEAITKCDSVIKLFPENDRAYYLRGLAYEDLHDRFKAMADLQMAGKINPDLDEYWDKIKDLQKRLDDDFLSSPCKRNLDQALIYIEDEQPDLALGQVDLALQCIPESATAYTWLGSVYQSMGKDDQAIEAYEHAINLNTRYYPARSKLANLQPKVEEEQSRLPVDEIPEDYYQDLEQKIAAEEAEGIEPSNVDVTPTWVYKGGQPISLENPIDLGKLSDSIQRSHILDQSEPAREFGIVIRKLFTGSFRTHNPVFLICIFLLGCVFFLPIAIVVLPIITGTSPSNDIDEFLFIFAVPGLILFWNVLMSLFTPDDGSMDDDGRKFY